LPPDPSIPVRSLPSSGGSVSALTLTVDPTGAGPAADREVTELLRRAVASGVTTFDVSGARQPDRAERLLGSVARDTAGLQVIVARSAAQVARDSVNSRSTEADGVGIEAALQQSLRPSRSRLTDSARLLLVWGDEGEPSPGGIDPNPPAAARLGLAGIVRRVSTGSPAPPVGAGVWIGPLSPLDTGLVPRFGGADGADGRVLLATDPFSGGRLDGTRFSTRLADRPSIAEPRSIRELHAEFDPVLRLGFLTEGHRRTLAQAAVEFALSFPWVATVVAPLPRADRLAELLTAAGGPGISADDRERILADPRASG
jgi:aryl-alcohol dehydrogenase-like predicted oxidoreductase